jgi:hypothetical protein
MNTDYNTVDIEFKDYDPDTIESDDISRQITDVISIERDDKFLTIVCDGAEFNYNLDSIKSYDCTKVTDPLED